MINLLFIAKNTSNSLDKNFDFLEAEFAKLTNMIVFRKSGRISEILKKITNQPDFILLANDLGKEMSPIIKGIPSVNIPAGLIVSDVHRFTETRRHFIRKNHIKYIFSISRGKFYESYPEYKDKMLWLPHFINPALYKDYGLEKDIDLLMMGAVNDVYPLRKKILHFYQKEPNFIYHPHPGYDAESVCNVNSFYIGERYAREINRAKIFFTCPSVYHYPVMKYFEALACKTLLLAPTFKELEDLGFIPGTHFIAIDEDNFMEKARYFLKNDMERRRIAEQGYHFVHKFHSLSQRARQLIKNIEEIIKNERMF